MQGPRVPIQNLHLTCSIYNGGVFIYGREPLVSFSGTRAQVLMLPLHPLSCLHHCFETQYSMSLYFPMLILKLL